MRHSDIKAALRLWNRTPGASTVDTPAEVRSFLRRNPGMSLVAFRDGVMAAAVLGGHDGRRGVLWHMAVLPRWRGCGLGRAMVARALEIQWSRGIRKVNILVLRDNHKALRFWRRLGWKPFPALGLSMVRPKRRGK